MIKHIWSLLCQESVINEDDKSLSINKIIEGVNIGVKVSKNNKIGEKINIPIKYEIVSLFTREKKRKEEEKADVILKLLSPRNEELSMTEKEIVIGSNSKSLRFRIKASGIVVKESGTYHFSINIKNKNEKEFVEVIQIPLEVNIKTEG